MTRLGSAKPDTGIRLRPLPHRPDATEVGRTEDPRPAVEASGVPWKLLLVLFAGSLAIRVAFALVSDNEDGDAFARIVYSRMVAQQGILVPTEDWLPGHFWLLALPRAVGLGNQMSLRLVTAVTGALAVPCTYLIGDMFFGRRAALVTALILAFNPLHIRFSTITVSESFFILLVAIVLLSFLRHLAQGGTRHLIIGAAALDLAASLRAEAWLLAGVLPAVAMLSLRRPEFPEAKTLLRRALAFAMAGSVFTGGWLVFSWIEYGDPLHLLTLASQRIAMDTSYQQVSTWHTLIFWPVVLCVSLGPIFFIAALLGTASNLKRSGPRFLALMFTTFTLIYYVQNFRSGLITDARYGLFLTWLLALNMGAVVQLEPRFSRSSTAAVAVAWLLLVWAIAEAPFGVLSQKFGSITPRPRFESDVRRVDSWLRTHATDGPVVLGPGLRRYGPWLSELDEWRSPDDVHVVTSPDWPTASERLAAAGHVVADKAVANLPPGDSDLREALTVGPYVVYRWGNEQDARSK